MTTPAVKARRGRPPHVRRFWDNSSIKRNLWRMYACTTMFMDDVCRLLQVKSGNEVNLKKRSTEMQVQKLRDIATSKRPRPATRKCMSQRVVSFRKSKTLGCTSQTVVTDQQLSVLELPYYEGPSNDDFILLGSGVGNPPITPLNNLPELGEYEANHAAMDIVPHSFHAFRRSQAVDDLFEEWIRQEKYSRSFCGEVRSLLSSTPSSPINDAIEAQKVPKDDRVELTPSMEENNSMLAHNCCSNIEDSCLHRRVFSWPSEHDEQGLLSDCTNQETGPGGVASANWRKADTQTLLILSMYERDSVGDSILHVVARWGNMVLIRQLLEHKECRGIINATNSNGETFLHVLERTQTAFWENLVLLIEQLKALGFNFNLRNRFGDTAMSGLIFGFGRLMDDADQCYQRLEQFYKAVQCRELERPTETASTSILWEGLALFYGRDGHHHGPPVQHLGAGIFEPRDASCSGCCALASYFQRNTWTYSPFEVLPPDHNGNSFIHYTLDGDCASVDTQCSRIRKEPFSETVRAQVLAALGKGASPNDFDSYGLTVLHRSVCDYELTQALLDFGADVNKIDARSEIPLQTAVRHSTVKVVDLLLRHGSNPEVRNFDGQNALDIVVTALGSPEIKKDDPRYIRMIPIMNVLVACQG